MILGIYTFIVSAFLCDCIIPYDEYLFDEFLIPQEESISKEDNYKIT